MADYIFLQPHGRTSLDGGGAFTSNLIAALKAAGHGAVTAGVGTSSRATLGDTRIVVIDGLALASVAPDQVSGAVGLIHHFGDPPCHAVLPHLRRVIATSHAVATRLVAEFGVQSGRVAVVTPGVSSGVRSQGSGGPSCAILSIGALVPRKGHAALITALLKLVDLDWQLTIVGDKGRDPATTDALSRLAEPAGHRVRFTGPLHAAALDELWQRTDLFALATQWEGHGAAVCEALRRGVPVAVTSGGAAAEAVTPRTGVICEVGDVVNLSKALRRLIYDSELRAAMAEAAWIAGAALPSWVQQAEKFVAVTR